MYSGVGRNIIYSKHGDMVYPKTYYRHIVGDIHVDETLVQKWV
jgi:hypothetical protein